MGQDKADSNQRGGTDAEDAIDIIDMNWSMVKNLPKIVHFSRDLFLSPMINEDKTRKKPVGSSRTFRL